ncbi:MAG: hypothetical protein ACTHMJ_04230, partial [Thermomicrobiales bacterium]
MNQLRQANTSDGGWATTQRHQHDPPNEASEGLRYLDTPGQPDEVWDETIALLAGELVALRTRLVAVEAAVGRPGPVGAPAPPTLPVLARRIATLERQAGIVPGLDLLAGPP